MPKYYIKYDSTVFEGREYWIGLTPNHQTLLMNLNDKHGCNFDGIANVLLYLD